MKANYMVVMMAMTVGGESEDNKVAEKSPGISSKKLQVAEGEEPIKGEKHPGKYKKNQKNNTLKKLRKKSSSGRRNG